MNLTFNDNINGLFSVSHAGKWRDRNIERSISNYVILMNFGESIHLQVDFEKHEIRKNQLCFINPGSYMASFEFKDDQHFIIEFNSAFYCLDLHDKEVSCNGLLFGALPAFPVITATDEEANDQLVLINTIKKEFDLPDTTQGDMLRLLLKRLIIICVRIARSQLFSNSAPLTEDTDMIRKFQALVEKNFRDKHKVADYAELMFKSPKTLSNTFKKLSGVNPLQIIQERIILEAKRLLFYTDKTIKEITFELGFEEPAHFSRLFKKLTGESPSQFQADLTKGSIANTE
ncbi:helix-turn-helix domain-containing protein [Carboxylicivirga sp. RSCT41]|uniref:helix-turn-helix domain-containing protein n=1 Tax=Carboxylicivirga agarovorans TaxID=3417570 RepID=UPI003D347953